MARERTGLETLPAELLEGVAGTPVDVCRPVRALVVQPEDAEQLGLDAGRFTTNQLRPSAALVEAPLGSRSGGGD